jgi:hypothetical protein
MRHYKRKEKREDRKVQEILYIVREKTLSLNHSRMKGSFIKEDILRIK